MTSTDNAFIRAYTRRADQAHATTTDMASHAHKIKPISVGVDSQRTSEIVVAPARSKIAVDQHIAAPEESVEVELPPTNGGHTKHSPADHSPADHSPRARPPASDFARIKLRSQSTAQTTPKYRHDPSDPVLPPRPHLDVAAFQPDTATQSVDRASQAEPSLATPLRPFRPEWEVDSFRWPSICRRLQEGWSSSLSGIVRSIIREAWAGRNVVAVTQYARGEGSTTVALCLARLAAAISVRAAVVDGHSLNPQLGTALGLSFPGSWMDPSIGNSFEEAAVSSIQDRLVVFPQSGPIEMESPSSHTDQRRIRLVHELSRSFELVVVDAGPAFFAAHNWFTVGGPLQSAVVVHDVRTTSTEQVQDVLHRLRGANITNNAIIENFQQNAAVS